MKDLGAKVTMTTNDNGDGEDSIGGASSGEGSGECQRYRGWWQRSNEEAVATKGRAPNW